MLDDLRDKINNCLICQKRITEKLKPAGTIKSFKVVEPGQLVAFDLICPITETISRKRHIIVGIDCFTRFVVVEATETTSAEPFAKFLTDDISTFGVLKAILTDSAKTLKNSLISDISNKFGFKNVNSAPNHHEGNAIAERVIQTIEDKINLISQQNQTPENRWDEILPIATLSINTATYRSTAFSPFELTFGRTHNAPDPIKQRANHNVFADLIRQQMTDLRAHAALAQEKAQEQSKKYFNQRDRELEFNVNDRVWMRTRDRKSEFANNFAGSFGVINKNADRYIIECEKTTKQFDRNINQLRKYNDTNEKVNYNITLQSHKSHDMAHQYKTDETGDSYTRFDKKMFYEIIIAATMIISSIHALYQEKIYFQEAESLVWISTKQRPTETRKNFKINIILPALVMI